MATAIVLFSGGLDSLLTTRILQEQGIKVIGLYVATPFQDESESARGWAEKFGIELVVQKMGDDYVKMLVHPRWGVGKGMNPCIDCRIAMCRAAARLMEERGADFVATGEIAGQRPNSQKLHQLNLISKECGLRGRLLRPLTAKTLAPTEMEETEMVDREKLYSYTGRSRGRLIRRAKDTFGIRPIPQPSTGCLLAEKSFAPRIRDLVAHKPEPTLWDMEILPVGRHIRIDGHTKAIVSRREEDGKRLVAMFARADRSPSLLMTPENFFGTTALIVSDTLPTIPGQPENREVGRCTRLAGGLLIRFTNARKFEGLNGNITANLFLVPDHGETVPIFPDPVAENLKPLEEAPPRAPKPDQGEGACEGTGEGDASETKTPPATEVDWEAEAEFMGDA